VVNRETWELPGVQWERYIEAALLVKTSAEDKYEKHRLADIRSHEWHTLFCYSRSLLDRKYQMDIQLQTVHQGILKLLPEGREAYSLHLFKW